MTLQVIVLITNSCIVVPCINSIFLLTFEQKHWLHDFYWLFPPTVITFLFTENFFVYVYINSEILPLKMSKCVKKIIPGQFSF